MCSFINRRIACLALASVVVAGSVSIAEAARWGRNRRAVQAPAATTTVNSQSSAPGPLGISNGYNSGNSGSGWNRNNSWYNIPQYGNYAPPPYATSRQSFIQVGPLPAFGGVRSLPGWGGAR